MTRLRIDKYISGVGAVFCALFVASGPAAAQGSGGTPLCAGAGNMRAELQAVQGAGETHLFARMTLPTPGWVVKFEQRPEKILPPRYNLICTRPSGVVTQVLTEHSAHVAVPGEQRGRELTVHDSAGARKIKVWMAIPKSVPSGPVADGSSRGAIGATCGGFAGAQCQAGLFCERAVGQCGVADAQGVCAAKPQICSKEFKPVCGCDGKTYGNACEAKAKGVSVQKIGQCGVGSDTP